MDRQMEIMEIHQKLQIREIPHPEVKIQTQEAKR